MSVTPLFSSGPDSRPNGDAISPEELLAKKDAEIQRLGEEVNALRRQKDGLEQSLNAVLSSRSWRATELLRRGGRALKLFWPLWRNRKHRFEAVCGRNVSLTEGCFEVTGSSPTLALMPVRGRVPTGWAKLTVRTSSNNIPLFFLLYFGRQGEFNPANRIWLSLHAQEVSQVVRIPEWTDNLRLDPFDSGVRFQFESFQIQELGKLQVAAGIISQQLKPILLHPPLLVKKVAKLISLLKEGGWHALRVRLFANDYTSNYQEWVQKYDTLDDASRSKIRSHCLQLSYRPLISVVMPVFNVPEKWLRAAIESVLNQIYDNWELCIADDASTEPHVRQVLEEYQSKNDRIKVVFRNQNGHIAKASNSALELAGGDYIALLDNDDELTEDALYQMAVAVNANREAGLIYSDEDKITPYGMRFNPYFKPDWNPELFLVQNYICHLSLYRRDIVSQVGGFREGLEGAQDWDLALRVIEKLAPHQIVHVPHVLYHWRVIEGSTAQSTGFKPYVMAAQTRAVSEHLERVGVSGAQVEVLPAISHLKVSHPLPAETPLVSIIIPTRDQCAVLKRGLDSIFDKTSYKNYEVIIVDNGSSDADTLQYLGGLRDEGKITLLRDERPFNFSRLNNEAVSSARGEILAFLNNDLEVISGKWLSEMVSQVIRPNVGAVGARLLFPNDLVQHAGVILGIGGVAGHSHKGRPRQDPGYFNTCILTHTVSAVTAACMLVRKEAFLQVGGFDEESLAVAFNDVDFCLKLMAAGYRNIYCAEAELYHHESVSRGHENTPQKFRRFEREIEVMKKRWERELSNDRYYNPNLTLLTEDYTFSFPPRCTKPWSDI
ncbi:MAG: glycosyltransferase family 2 protein [Deltaproteobacteria bacterium]|nr:glycosyltransferase family 2 protein [Deltaproteobacteria bacterium]